MSVPTSGEEMAKLIYHWDEAQSCAYKLGHLARAQANTGKDRAMADGWIAVGEMMKRMRFQMVELAKGKMQ